MNYRVAWDPVAFRDLRRAWIAAGQPESGIRAFEAIERVLRTDAHLQGESRAGDRRILVELPISVIFEARPDVGEVLILDAWIIRDRRP